MEILQFLLSFLLDEYGAGALKPILDGFLDNSFDIKKTLSGIKAKDLLPILQDFLSGTKNTPSDNGRGYKTMPIESIADKSIVETLNKYFEETSA